jgi:hypothetical protein
LQFSEEGGGYVPSVSGDDTILSEFDWGGRSSVALIDGRYKYIRAQKSSQKRELLFDLAHDPKETVDQSGMSPEQVRDLSLAVDRIRAIAPEMREAASVPVKVDDTTKERLKALGYVE